MNKLSFRRWLEALENPEATAAHWMQNAPKGPPQQNEAAIDEFVNVMADPTENGLAIAYDLENRGVYELRYKHRPIAGSLINTDDENLRTAEGIITNQFEPEFVFWMGGSKEGSLVIQHPPLIFDRVDRDMLHSIIWHELGHAIDWINPRFRKIKPYTRSKWNAEAYSKNIHEARQIADQLKVLLRKLGSVEKVMAALEGKRGYEDLSDIGDPTLAGHLGEKIGSYKYRPTSPFKLNEDLLPAARAFLQMMERANESFTSKLAGYFLAGAGLGGLFGGDAPKQPPAPVPIQRNVQVANVHQQEVYLASWCVNQIITLLQFKNFIFRA